MAQSIKDPDGIKTDRLLLREARLCDLDSFHAMFGDDEVMKFWYTLPFHL